jgi:dTMP kinase
MLEKPIRKGFLITFEGIEGVGKTTQIQRVSEILTLKGYSCVISREPGGSHFGNAIRSCLLNDYDPALDAHTELCLLLAGRRYHYKTVIEPALTSNKLVLIDRFIDASYAYQGYGREVPLETITALHKEMNLPLTTDLTILLDASTKQSRERIQGRFFLDRIEKEDEHFFNKVREGYLTRAKQDPTRIKIIDAIQEKEVISHIILENILRVIDEK